MDGQTESRQKKQRTYFGLPTPAAITAAVHAMGVGSSAVGCSRQLRLGRGGRELGHIDPRAAIARPNQMTLVATQCSSSGTLAAVLDEITEHDARCSSGEDRREGTPFLVGDGVWGICWGRGSLGVRSRKATLQGLPIG